MLVLYLMFTPLTVGIFWGVLNVFWTAVVNLLLALALIKYTWRRRVSAIEETSTIAKIATTIVVVLVCIGFVWLRAVT